MEGVTKYTVIYWYKNDYSNLNGLLVRPKNILLYRVQSSLPIPPISGLTKKRQYSETGGERSHIKPRKTLFGTWKGRQYLGGGGGERGAGIGGGGATVYK